MGVRVHLSCDAASRHSAFDQPHTGPDNRDAAFYAAPSQGEFSTSPADGAEGWYLNEASRDERRGCMVIVGSYSDNQTWYVLCS